MQVFLQFDDFLTACKKNISLHKCKGNVFSTVLYKIHQDCIYIYSLVPTCLLSHFMMYSGLKFLLAPVNEVGSLTRRSWKFLAVSFLPCGMTTIMYPDKGLVQAKGDVFILLTTNSWFPIAVQFAVCITRKRRQSVKIFIFVLKESSGLEWNAKTGRETNEGKQQHDAKALPYKPKPSSVI